jgi:D-alanyl-lipoteichoic acid acyltransferase DltB (MBOAT superfamily)
MIHFIIESYKKQISQINLLNFINYIFFFPAFISGPINRYNHFCTQLKLNNDNLKSDLQKGLERIIHGLFKKFVLCTIIFPYTIVNLEKPIFDLNGLQILIGCYAYAFYFYFDFSGYSDVAIGSAKIMGIELPENFDNPFFKKNIQQLWANWHISFTSWLTDYIYWPLSKKLRNLLYFKKRPVFLSNFSIIVTFIVCGMWHGDTIYFVLWGLYHGVGLAVLNTYKKYKRKVRNKTIRVYYRSKYSEVIGVVATFNFFSIGLLFFAF